MTRRDTGSTTIARLFLATAGRRLLLGALLAVLTVLAGIALLGLSGWFITAAGLAGLTAGALAFNVFAPSAGVRLLALARTAGRYGERVITHDATLAALAALRERLFRGWARPGAARRLLRRPARLLFRLTADIDALESLYLRVGVPVAAAAGAALLAGVVLGALDAALGLAIAVWLMLVGLGVTRRVARRARPLALRRAAALERLREQAVDLVAGQTDLAMAGRLRAQCDALRATDARLARADRALQRLEARAGATFSIAGSLTLAAVLLAAGALVERGRIDAPAAALALLVALAAMEPFAALRRGAIEAGRGALAARRLAPVLREAPEPAPVLPAEADDAVALTGVRAAHDGASGYALQALDLRLHRGERVAVIGPSGSGKSTLLSLIAGELAPLAGTVRAPAASWLTQRVELFQDSLADNLRLADPAAPDDRLRAVLRAAGLQAEVDRLARGLDTPLGEGGLGLSGGQARRLALARLLLRPTRLWLLDEPTESLDADTARDVLARLAAQAGDRTLLIATHLRREAALADRLLVLSHGRLVADLRRGTPDFDRALHALRGDRPFISVAGTA
ncbi:thiol reductant ABC exporter subunit CydC [Mitsuaria sp. GD03876]|uniref:thiol reductant ABC exporter subunit CydC n=1 Tax=Mitsuaria sp. GD03876 TaxID=2975399 RepID=UPI002449649E|nr:thiol reductant ABC exporter subunit CydC [Mitsuaria sp. GD03876]MDH0866164.1 thiol reductant ABC exporter subunit CydC [Mitsuaria sp. GD03876]